MTLGRRGFLQISLGALLGARTVAAQPASAVRRVGILASSTRESFEPNVQVFRENMERLGWVEGRNLALEARYASEQYQQLATFAAELVRLKVDVIFAMAAPAIQAAKRATSTIPIVIETLGDAVSAGLVSNLARPGGNVTGVSGFAPQLSSKRLGLIRDLLPTVSRVALLVNRTNPATAVVVRTTQAAADEMRMHLVVADVPRPAALEDAFASVVRERCQAFVLAADPMLFSQRRRIVELAARHRLPGVYEYQDFADSGGLLSYGPDHAERFQKAAAYVDRILRGAKPGELPVEQPSTFLLVLNLKTAASLGLAIPESLRLRAQRVLE